MTAFNTSQRPEFAILLLSMLLILQNPTDTTGGSAFYEAVRSLYWHISADVEESIELIQAGLLIACYEYASGLVKASCKTVGSCAHMASWMSFHAAGSELTADMSDTSQDEVAEKHNIWWALVGADQLLRSTKCYADALDKHFAIHRSTIPTDLPLEAEDLDSSISTTIRGRSFNQFGLQARAALLFDQAAELCERQTAGIYGLEEYKTRVDAELRSFMALVIEKNGGRACGYCEATSLTLAALFLIHGPCMARPVHFTGLRDASNAASSLAMQTIIQIAVDIGYHFNTVSNTLNMTKVPPTCPQVLYLAAVQLLHSSDTDRAESTERVEVLREALWNYSRRWQVAAHYLEEVDQAVLKQWSKPPSTPYMFQPLENDSSLPGVAVGFDHETQPAAHLAAVWIMAPPGQELHKRVKTGCVTCRKRHIKCDEKKPTCRHCEIGYRDCQYDFAIQSSTGPSLADGRFQFSSEHVWLDTPSQVTFVHSVDVEGDASSDPFSASTPGQDISTDGTVEPSDSPFRPPVRDVPTPSVAVSEVVRDDATDIATPHAVDLTSPNSIISTESTDPVKSLVRMRMSESTLYTHGPIQPISDPLIARLLRNFINNLACWLDLNDPQRQFETFVPYLALSYPILLHAILAFSACHLHRLDGSCDDICAVHYHDLCIQGLIPALADPSTTLDNVLPISTVILRMYEMMSYETDHQRHLRGCSSLFTHNRRNIGYRALKRTAFWTYFREEIMVALATRKPTTIRPSSWKVDITWAGDTDYVKTEKMTMLTAEVIDHCFGEDAENNPEYAKRWDELQHETDTWKETLPETFRPLYMFEERKPFPEIMYSCTWHIVAMQFYHLVKVLLALHNPHRPKGMGFLHFWRIVEAEIRRHTLQLCGLTQSLDNRYPGALVNALQPLVICGQSLKTLEEQDELVHMLEQIEKSTTLATAQCIESLREAWSTQSYT
ncbi:hypothetical protein NQ176_g9304 [Zarea fungicola]|uniref:Uncharacterized protein n=1 Tax=Zarea fungicola TaxID=93591 RepID=A0ACC1MMF5_9HYPO|nr:hypothetical protein NQ176_g9304 [Lecanicillium fungicola]